jgi:hypothetical protein
MTQNEEFSFEEKDIKRKTYKNHSQYIVDTEEDEELGFLSSYTLIKQIKKERFHENLIIELVKRNKDKLMSDRNNSF